MEQALQTILDFVEGRLSAKAFEQLVYTDEDLERLLKDEAMKWHDTYIKTDPYTYVAALDYDDPGGVLEAQVTMELFLKRRGVPFRSDRTAADFYNLLSSAQPR